MVWLIYNLIFPIVFICMLPHFIFRMLRRGGYKNGFEQRFGIYSESIKKRLSENDHIWVHSVSVGEILVAFSFMEEFRAANPNARFVLTTNTSTAHKIACDRLDERDTLLYFPIDLPLIISKVLKQINPQKIVLVECELWPNLLRMAHKRSVPLCLINGRMSDRSFKGYSRIPFCVKPILQLFETVCVQGEKDAFRYLKLGVRETAIHLLGSAKYDVAKVPENAAEKGASILRQINVPEDSLVLVGGSTWPGEEALLIDAYVSLREKYQNLFLVLIPRHFERAAEVIATCAEKGVSFARRSELAGNLTEKPDLLFVDTTGEIMNFYAVADIVFVGKSFEPNHGGQNPIEPGACGKPILVGPNMENFPSVMDDMLKAKALIQLSEPEQLVRELDRLLSDNLERANQGELALELVSSKRGVMRETIKLVSESK